MASRRVKGGRRIVEFSEGLHPLERKGDPAVSGGRVFLASWIPGIPARLARNRRALRLVGIALAVALGTTLSVLSPSLPGRANEAETKDQPKRMEPGRNPRSFPGLVVAIDPGHGGIDPGAVSRDGLLEKDVVLAVALYLRHLLESAGADVVMTRETDEDLSLSDDVSLAAQKRSDMRRRANLVNLSRPDIFVSIHANHYPSSRWYGAQTFYHPRGRKGSRELAECIQEALVKVTKRTWRDASDVIQHYLLTAVEAPACTVEIGFMSNPEEAALLGNPEYQKLLAWSIFTGIGYYLARYGS